MNREVIPPADNHKKLEPSVTSASISGIKDAIAFEYGPDQDYLERALNHADQAKHLDDNSQ